MAIDVSQERAGHNRLEAINEVLDSIGEFPVPKLDTGGVSEASQAERHLDLGTRKICAQGWNFNTDFKLILSPDENGDIQVGNDVLWIDSDDTDRNRNVVRRDTRLYDQDNHTYTFDGPLVTKVIRLICFEDLPPKVKEYVVADVSRKFQQKFLGGQVQDAYNNDALARLMVEAKHADAKTRDRNILKTAEGRHILGDRFNIYRGTRGA